jgi:hypothetical protein
MTLYAELKQLLSHDFSADNLGRAANLAFEGSWNADHPAGVFVVTRVLRILEDQWDVQNSAGQAWMTAQSVRVMEQRMRPPLIEYLSALDADSLAPDAELGLLNAIVLALFKWTAERPSARPGG